MNCKFVSISTANGHEITIYLFYFIPSSEFNAYLKLIKRFCLHEEISYFFTSDEYFLYFFTLVNRGCFDNLGLNFFRKRSGMHRSCLTLRYECTHVK